jgi:hypothetical protein
MAGRSLFVAVAVFLALPAGPVAAQAIDMTGFVRGLYRDYLGREPTPDESLAWVRALQRGTSASEVHAFLMASDECFDRYKRDPNAWIGSAYTFVLHNRQPTARDLSAWRDRLNVYNGDRLRWSRDFLRGADWQAPSFLNPASTVTPAELPARLVTTCQLLVQSVQTELPGNAGWLAWTQANNLLTTAEANRLILAGGASPGAFLQAITNLQTAVDALRDTLSRTGPTATNSRQYADQVYQYLAVLRTSAPPPLAPQLPPYPPPAVIPPGSTDQPTTDRYQQLARDLQRQTQQFVFVLRNVSPRDYTVDRLLRDGEDYDAGVDRFRVQVKLATPLTDLRTALTNLRLQGDRISTQMRQGTFDRRVIQAWSDVSLTFGKLADALGISPADVDPWQPIPYTGPGSLPVNLGGQTTTALSPIVARNLDDAISQCDILTAALTPFTSPPLIISVQGELRTLRNSLTELRRQAIQGAPRAQLLRALSDAVEDSRRVETLWTRLLASPDLPQTLPDMTAFKRAFQQVNDPTLFSNVP